MELVLKMQKKKENFKNTFGDPISKYINVNKRYDILDVRYGGHN